VAKHDKKDIWLLIAAQAFSYTPFVIGLMVFSLLCGIVLYGCHDFSQWRSKREEEKVRKQWEALGITNNTERRK
jgi:hypothetical protein